jgi:hypothetical protein
MNIESVGELPHRTAPLASSFRLRQLEGMPEERPKGWRHWGNPAKPKKAPPPVLVRFTAESGEVWTVWDVSFSKFKHARQAHCEPSARSRVFVNAAGVRRTYTFKRNESRVLAPRELQRQLREAGILGGLPDMSQQRPR